MRKDLFSLPSLCYLLKWAAGFAVLQWIKIENIFQLISMLPKKKKAKKEAKGEGEIIEIYSQHASFFYLFVVLNCLAVWKMGSLLHCPIHHGNKVFFCEFFHFFFFYIMVNRENLLAELLHFVYIIYYRYISRIVHKIGPSMLVHVYVYEVTTTKIKNNRTSYTVSYNRWTWLFLFKQ